MLKFEDVEVCDCECHREGVNIMHSFVCCNLCGDTYLTKDGAIIPEKLYPLLRETHLNTLTRRRKKGLR